MQALEVSGAANSFPGDRDKPLRPNAVGYRVKIKSRLTTLLGSGVVAHQGESVVLVLKRDLPAVLAQAWDDEEPQRIEQAKATFEREIHSEVAKKTDRLDAKRVAEIYEQTKALTQSQVEDLFRVDPEALQIWKIRKETYRETGNSWEACFQRMFYRGVKPLVSAEVLEEGVQPEEVISENDTHKTLAGNLVREVLAQTQSQQATEIAELKKQLADLQDQLTAPRGKSKG